jgi:hypothetical protein
MRHCIKFYKEFCVKKAKERRLIELELRHKLNKAMETLQGNPGNLEAQNQVSTTASSLQGFERYKVEGQCIRSKLK